MGKETTLVFFIVVEVADDVDAEIGGFRPAGEAGSAAARARKTQCVFLDRSAALGFTRRASAYNTPWMSFFLTEARRVSSGVE